MKTLLLFYFLVGLNNNPAVDTIDNWTVFYNNKKIKEFNY